MVLIKRKVYIEAIKSLFLLCAAQCFVRKNMDPGYLIGSLAFFTIGSILLLSVVHFRQLLNNPEDRRHIDNILHDGKAATTVAAERLPRGTAVPLKTRLDNSIASQHPADPGATTSQANRVGELNVQKAAK